LYCLNVKTAIQKKIGGKRVGAGRPATGHDPSRTFRLSDEFMTALDAWAARQEDKPSRSEAIRRLVELGLKARK
jgi:Ribbon-helix-helix protein, copG family